MCLLDLGDSQKGLARPSILLCVFLESGSLDSLNFDMMVESLMKLFVTEREFCEKLFLPKKLGGLANNGFLNLKKNLVISFHWICIAMIFYFVCCVLAQILYLEKVLFLRYRENALSQSDCRIFKSTIYPEQIDLTVSFFACWCKFLKIKILLKSFGWAWQKCVGPIWSLDSKIDCISRINR